MADDPDAGAARASGSAAPGWRRSTISTLRGRAGAVQLEVNARRPGDPRAGPPGGHAGRGRRLTIDAGLQQSVLRRLGDESASAVVLDCRNGEVLAMATNPSFDPTLFNSGVSQAQWAEWTRDRRTPLINSATAGSMRRARPSRWRWRWRRWRRSVMTPGDRVHCPGYLDLGDARFHCWRKGGHGTLDMRGGIKNSCDVYFYEIGQARRHRPHRRDGAPLRSGHRPGDRPARRAPGLHADARNGASARAIPGTSATRSSAGIGQGYIQVTPLQLATYAARVAGRAMHSRWDNPSFFNNIFLPQQVFIHQPFNFCNERGQVPLSFGQCQRTGIQRHAGHRIFSQLRCTFGVLHNAEPFQNFMDGGLVFILYVADNYVLIAGKPEIGIARFCNFQKSGFQCNRLCIKDPSVFYKCGVIPKSIVVLLPTEIILAFSEFKCPGFFQFQSQAPFHFFLKPFHAVPINGILQSRQFSVASVSKISLYRQDLIDGVERFFLGISERNQRAKSGIRFGIAMGSG